MGDSAIQLVRNHIKERIEAVACIDENLKKIARRAREILGGDARIYVFGSYVSGGFDVYLSDVDVLIVSSSVEKCESIGDRAEIILKIKEGIKGAFIFQIHLVTPKEFEYYRFFIDRMMEL